jgi:hypothetical protein
MADHSEEDPNQPASQLAAVRRRHGCGAFPTCAISKVPQQPPAASQVDGARHPEKWSHHRVPGTKHRMTGRCVENDDHARARALTSCCQAASAKRNNNPLIAH